MFRRTRAVAAVAVIATLLVTGCDQGTGEPTPSPTATSATPTVAPTTPTPTPTALTPEEEDLRGAEQAVVALEALTDQLGQDFTRRLDELYTVSRDQTVDTRIQILNLQRVNGQTQIGNSVVEDIQVTKNAEGLWDATACLDTSGVNVVDKDGKSVVNPDGPARVKYRYLIEKGSDGGFYVIEDEAVETC